MRRATAQPREQGGQVEQAVLHQAHGQGQEQLHAADPRFCGAEWREFGVAFMRLVMAGDGADYATFHCSAQAVSVSGGAQRWLHVVKAGEVTQRFIGKNQLIKRDIGCHRQAASLGVCYQLGTACAGQLAEVRAHTGLFNQQQVAGQCHRFCRFRNAGQAEEAGGWAFVSQAAFGQIMILRVENNRQVKGGRVFQGAAQGTVIAEVVQTIAEGDTTRIAQGYQFGKLLALQAFAECANWKHLGVAGFAGAVENQLSHRWRVQHGLGEGRAA